MLNPQLSTLCKIRNAAYPICVLIKRFAFLATLIISPAACKYFHSDKQETDNLSESFIVEGTLTGGQNKYLIFQEIKVNSFFTIDTILLDNNGSFRYQNKILFPAFYALKNDLGDYIILMPDTSQIIEIQGNYALNNYTLKGSQDSEAIAELHFNTRQFLDQVAAISAITRDSAESPDYPVLKMKLVNKYDSVYSDIRRFSIHFIEKNSTSPAIIFALYNKTGPDTYILDPVKDLEIFVRADSILYYLYPDFSHVKSLHDRVNLIKTQLATKAVKSRKQEL